MTLSDAEQRRMRWRCRRGMRELDVLFERYLSGRYPSAPANEQDAFLALMDCEDTDVWNYCLKRAQPGSAAVAAVIERMIAPDLIEPRVRPS